MSRANDRHGKNTEDRQEQIRERKAEAERKQHAEERELAPEIPVAPVENPDDPSVTDPEAPGPRYGDQR